MLIDRSRNRLFRLISCTPLMLLIALTGVFSPALHSGAWAQGEGATAEESVAANATDMATPPLPPLDFMVILPGSPETPEEALQAVDGLAAFLANRTGHSMQGGFSNDPVEALRLLEQEPPQWGVVSLGFYLQHATRLKMTALASTLPGGAEKDVWRVLTAPGYREEQGKAKKGWKLKGNFKGSMLFDREAAACLLLRGRSGGIVGLQGERAPLMALRDLESGAADAQEAGPGNATAASPDRDRLAGVVLDQLQYDAVAHLPYKDELHYIVLFEVPNLPTSPVVWFGDGANSEEAVRLRSALRAAGAASELRQGLALLRTAGFGPADTALPGLVRECGQ